MGEEKRIVITGVGLTSPIGNELSEFRKNLLAGKSGIKAYQSRYVGEVPAGICDFDNLKYQRKKEVKRGTRAGSIAIYCAHEALADAQVEISDDNRSEIGIYIGTTEHGNVETENEVYELSQNNYDIQYWSHHHNPRTVSNNPAGEVTLNLKITGPHYCIGAACAAGNLGVIQGYQMLKLGEVDMAIAGGVSESIHTFGIFASFKSQLALGHHSDPQKVSRPFDNDRNGIVVSEGGCLFVLETLEHALKRGAKNIYAEIVGYGNNSDATDFVMPNGKRQAECIRKALKFAELSPNDIDIVNMHATSTPSGDVQEVQAVREVFRDADTTYVNNTKGHIGHSMGAAGALELAGNLSSFEDGMIHPTINVDNLDPDCEVKNLVANKSIKHGNINYILNNSFGMLGINSSLIIKRYENF
ncbi:beta-ketoacyl-[acyl-carrier-protein] synthase family protein [Candidatus Auribacterota bacterium]